MKKILFGGYIVSLHIAVALMAIGWLQIGGNRPLETREAAPTVGQNELTEHYHRMVKYHKLMDENVAAGSAVFIGDSHMQGLWVTGVTPLSVNYGIGGDTTFGVLRRISHYRSVERANLVVISIGLNDFEFRSADRILDNYREIVDSIPEAIPVIFCAVLPVNEKVRESMRGRNSLIQYLNAKLKEFCESSRRLHFVDIGPQLIDPDGNLTANFSDSGGVHLNHKGNDLWINHLKRVTAEIVKPMN
jgi:lysophospholipase L1-like esterase